MSEELTVLTTEHYTLQTARQACLQDMQGRATLFLYSISAVLVALGFMASTSGSRERFVVFTVTLLQSIRHLVVGLIYKPELRSAPLTVLASSAAGRFP